MISLIESQLRATAALSIYYFTLLIFLTSSGSRVVFQVASEFLLSKY